MICRLCIAMIMETCEINKKNTTAVGIESTTSLKTGGRFPN